MLKSRKPSPLSIEDFSFLPESSLPALVLGYHVPTDHFRSDSLHSFTPDFNRGREFKKIVHANHYWFATMLTPTSIAKVKIDELVRGWAGQIHVTLDILLGYRVALKRILGADCNRSYPLLSSNHFPMDVEFAAGLAGDILPWGQLDSLIEWKSGHERAVHGGKWRLAVLGGEEKL